MTKSGSEKEIIRGKAEALKAATEKFCDEYLDDEYKELCIKLIDKMSRKRTVPFLTGKLEIWAAAIVYAIGSINFLFDRNLKPYATADDICDFFGTSKSTTGQKAKLIRDMFKMGYYDTEFATQKMAGKNPFKDMVSINGFIVPLSMLPPEVREQVEMELNKKGKR